MRCPVCRAENDQGPQCRRCRADLGLLFALEAQRRRAMAAAQMCLVQGEPRRARAILAGAAALRDDADARQLIAVAALLCRDYAAAWRAYDELAAAPASRQNAAD